MSAVFKNAQRRELASAHPLPGVMPRSKLGVESDIRRFITAQGDAIFERDENFRSVQGTCRRRVRRQSVVTDVPDHGEPHTHLSACIERLEPVRLAQQEVVDSRLGANFATCKESTGFIAAVCNEALNTADRILHRSLLDKRIHKAAERFHCRACYSIQPAVAVRN